MTRTAEQHATNGSESRQAPTCVLELDCLSVSYVVGERVKPAVQGVSFTIREGGFLSLVGPSGCGKSTLLHAAAGLIRPSAGTVTYLGQRWVGLLPEVGYVTQKDTLLPWRNVVDNIALPLQLGGMGKSERRSRAEEMAVSLGLGDYLRHFPSQLSGGMRQRVQLGRTLVGRPKLLLMDEPFGALDAYLRLRMQELLLSILAEHRLSTLFVTHDLAEAISLSDEVVAMTGSPGRVGLTCTVDDLPDRTDLMAIRGNTRFAEYQRLLWDAISASGSPA
ncbi:MAG: ABC transporter ATP-binding protein [Chloroflexota bacterium]|nr:ABC transporter ATP-binding protein [Chloroflexota bacterium]